MDVIESVSCELLSQGRKYLTVVQALTATVTEKTSICVLEEHEQERGTNKNTELFLKY
jgi:hypothetical protein